MDNELINKINLMYPLIIDSTILHDETENQILTLIKLFKRKFETKIMSN